MLRFRLARGHDIPSTRTSPSAHTPPMRTSLPSRFVKALCPARPAPTLRIRLQIYCAELSRFSHRSGPSCHQERTFSHGFDVECTLGLSAHRAAPRVIYEYSNSSNMHGTGRRADTPRCLPAHAVHGHTRPPHTHPPTLGSWHGSWHGCDTLYDAAHIYVSVHAPTLLGQLD